MTRLPVSDIYMSWPATLEQQAIDAGQLGPLTPLEVLYDFEGPCIFTAHAPSGGLLLAYLVEELEQEEYLRYLVATTSEQTISELKEGLVSVRQALTRGWLWLADLDHHHEVKRAFQVSVEQLPDDALPAGDTMLWAHLEPALRVRLEGADIRPGKIPALVFSQAGEIAAKALKSVFEFVARDWLPETVGRPPEWLRALYNLPTQRLSYGSLEVSFRAPDLPRDAQTELTLDPSGQRSIEELVEDGWDLLRRGLAWASGGSGPDKLDAASDEERLAVLEALRRLAPNSTGPVVEVTVSGTKVGVGHQAHKLDRSATKKIRTKLTALKRRKDVQLQVFQGRVRDLDLDKLTFILRDIPGEVAQDVAFVMEDEQFLEIAREAHYQELEVKIAGRSADGKLWTVVGVGFVG